MDLVIFNPFAIIASVNDNFAMGKGDKKSKKGKRWRGSFGVSRNKKAIKTRLKRSASTKEGVVAAAPATKAKRTIKKKAEA
jgi:ribosomal small subunit protein bTHX